MDHLSRALRLEVTPDAMEARLSALTPRVHAGLRLPDLIRFLKQQGIVHGVLEDEVAQFLGAWKRSRKASAWTVARGTLPTSESEGGLRRLDPPPRNGRDPVELLPLFVKKGDALFVREGRCEGTPGRDVRGQPFLGVLESDAQDLSPGVGIVVDGRTWRAEGTGFLEVLGNVVYVVPRLIHRHDLPVARYRWDGDAELLGAVRPGTRLSVAGNLVIIGDVGADVKIHAGGNLTIHGCVTGDNTTRLEAAGTMELGELQRATLLAGRDARAQGPCVGCHICTRGRFTCDGPTGLVFGGHIEAVRGVSLGELLSDDKIACRVQVGHAGWLHEHGQDIEEEVKRWLSYSQGLVTGFENRHDRLLRDRARIYRLPKDERQAFERERERVTAEQLRVDHRIAELRTLKGRLLEGSIVDRKAVIRVRRTSRGTVFGIGSLTSAVRQPELGPVVLVASRRSQRILPIPQSVYDSSDMGEPELVVQRRR